MTKTDPSDRDRERTEGENGPIPGGESAAVTQWLPLKEGERIRWQGGPRIQTVLPWVAFALVGTAVLLAAIALDVVPTVAVVGVALLVIPALWQYARVSRTAFVVTNTVVATRHGVLGRTVRTVSLERIQNTTVEQDPIGRLVGHGTVTIEAASGSELAFWNVDDPGAIRDRLEAERERLTGRDVPGRRDQWEAVLAEVREWRRALE
ncbi:PH domain-containing protein [Natrinema salsiterrestre]|uniref:PH domain-containing protein n=1 Tax=Natrinema salsiterrestre TaxID=2950540 RepID=A0A9Q4Q022_9EURY|nr:PH domain-containing protein [Natrinema salsiterrestre]MDF9745214.1 PH domain-containing protein [Natrinema salsiterrestre]